MCTIIMKKSFGPLLCVSVCIQEKYYIHKLYAVVSQIIKKVVSILENITVTGQRLLLAVARLCAEW